MKNSEKSSSVAPVVARSAGTKGGRSAKTAVSRKSASPEATGPLHVPGSGRAPSTVPVDDRSGTVGQGAGSDQTRIHSTRFVTVLPAIPEEDLGLLPSVYDADRIFAVPRDPERVFATWDLSAATRRRVQPFGMVIRFTFDDGENDEVVSDAVMPGSFQYYCAVPEGMVAVTAELAIANQSGLEVIASSGRVGLAIAFVRQGEPVFARVDRGTPLASGRTAIVESPAPGALPAVEVGDCPDEPAAARFKIGYMPVSGRK